ncbi:MAG: TetR/AcrR family transcriptional regulator; helix-turn-helix transcriptional regulator [Spirochaetaceae bacterium]|nr:TetR/AcrR family transcriptional regulator; helix-turn-helix transcriptional regulator [Spirochaetaceae bacterium]MCF7952294.1 TetR/AcrR family transcriptional regulator; helix-turn-helix transcriptional regulator [Spirochaetaceae bacterium]
MGISERRQREREERRRVIIEAARKVFLEKGIEHATMKDVAAEAELSKAALYLYFKNREELTFELLHISFSKIKQVIQTAAGRANDGFHKLQAIGNAFMRFYREEPEYIYFSLIIERYSYSIANNLPAAKHCLDLIHEIQNIIEQLLTEGVQDGSIRQDLDVEKTAVVFIHVSTSFMQRVSTMQETLAKDDRYESNELIEHMFTIFLYSLR